MARHSIQAMAAAMAAMVVSAGAAIAQEADPWPSRPVRLSVPAAAGSVTDIVARLVGDRPGKAMQQPVLVDNRLGASSAIAIATNAVAKATPDGNTLLFSNAAATVTSQAFDPKLPYDLVKDLAPVSQVGVGGVMLDVSSGLAVNNVRELAAFMKASPSMHVYGTWGVGTSGHLLEPTNHHE